MEIIVIRHQCCGNALCAEIAPDVFALDSKQKCVVIDAEAAPLEVLIEAAESCPCEAIVIEDDEGNKIAG